MGQLDMLENECSIENQCNVKLDIVRNKYYTLTIFGGGT